MRVPVPQQRSNAPVGHSGSGESRFNHHWGDSGREGFEFVGQAAKRPSDKSCCASSAAQAALPLTHGCRGSLARAFAWISGATSFAGVLP